MTYSPGVALAAAAVLALTGCGTSDEEDVARVLESYPHALAAGDAQAACAAFTQEAREQMGRSGSDLCAFLRATVAKMTLADQRRSAAAKAVLVEVEGERATGYLQYGDCIVTTSGRELRRSDSGDWRITGGLPTSHVAGRCLDPGPE